MRIIKILLFLTICILYNQIVIAQQRTIPLYRYYDTRTNDHYYTTVNEGKLGGTFLGSQIVAYVLPHPCPGSYPCYRFYNGVRNVHFYGLSSSQPDLPGYTLEGPVFYVYKTQFPGTVPVYRYYQGTENHHYYTLESSENAELIKDGYKLDGVVFYVYNKEMDVCPPPPPPDGHKDWFSTLLNTISQGMFNQGRYQQPIVQQNALAEDYIQCDIESSQGMRVICKDVYYQNNNPSRKIELSVHYDGSSSFDSECGSSKHDATFRLSPGQKLKFFSGIGLAGTPTIISATFVD